MVTSILFSVSNNLLNIKEATNAENIPFKVIPKVFSLAKIKFKTTINASTTKQVIDVLNPKNF